MAPLSAPRPSPFLHPPNSAAADSLAILHLRRDNLLPVELKTTADDGYAEGAVTNTRFGSFPHSTLIGLEWGSQVRASRVDTGTRGRNGKSKKQVTATTHTGDDLIVNPNPTATPSPLIMDIDASAPGIVSRKRRSEDDPASIEHPLSPTKKKKSSATMAPVSNQPTKRAPVEANSGFVHILPPAPETWTASLDHRTQVVYTPDYSYVLQHLRAQPGTHIIEAGAGSGSFTHAAIRAVFNGYDTQSLDTTSEPYATSSQGHVYSFEFHLPRVEALRAELTSHNLLNTTVTLTHRDVCNEGFLLSDGKTSPNANCIFLDLPAPWLALPHLTREGPNSPLDPNSAVHLCTFSPCIEQVMATCSTLRKLGWADIRMVEVQHRRLDVRRERIGFHEEGLHGVNAVAASVDEALARAREVEAKLAEFHQNRPPPTGAASNPNPQKSNDQRHTQTRQARLEKIREQAATRKLHLEGDLVHRTEPEIKTHTSYLVFAVLPREWTEEDEQRCLEMWGVEKSTVQENGIDGKKVTEKKNAKGEDEAERK